MQTLEDFRAETRTWLEQNCPDGAKGPGQMPLGSKSIKLEPDKVRRNGEEVFDWATHKAALSAIKERKEAEKEAQRLKENKEYFVRNID